MTCAEDLREPSFVVVNRAAQNGLRYLAKQFRARFVRTTSRLGDEAGRYRVTGLEWNLLVSRQRVRELRHRNPPLLRPRRETLAIEGGGAHRSRNQANRAIGIVEHGKDERLQVVLGIDDVSEGRVMDREQNAARLPERLAADGARMFECDRISLLRHDAA